MHVDGKCTQTVTFEPLVQKAKICQNLRPFAMKVCVYKKLSFTILKPTTGEIIQVHVVHVGHAVSILRNGVVTFYLAAAAAIFRGSENEWEIVHRTILLSLAA